MEGEEIKRGGNLERGRKRGDTEEVGGMGKKVKERGSEGFRERMRVGDVGGGL